MAKKGPCWKGYEMIGMKTKNGRSVPNCVKKASTGAYLGKAVKQPTETDKEFSMRQEYNGKFIKHDSAGIELSNKNLGDYYGDLLK